VYKIEDSALVEVFGIMNVTVQMAGENEGFELFYD